MASTVGTIMALLVFLTFLSLITNQYVPVWMKDSEAGHMGEALGQLGNFKSNVDIQMLEARGAGADFIPVTSYSSVKLGVDGVPIFSTSTIGQLVVDSAQAPWSVGLQYLVSGNPLFVPEWNCQYANGTQVPLPGPGVACGSVGGNVVLSVFNRYFPQQQLAYENGALIRSQVDGQIVRAPPSFRVLVTNTSVHVDFTLIQIFGSGGVRGVGAEGLLARVVGVGLEVYTKIRNTTDVSVYHNSSYGPAWYGYFNATLGLAYGIKSNDFTRPGFTYTQSYDASGRPTQLRAETPMYLVQSLWDSGKNWYNVVLRFRSPGVRDGVTVLPIGEFRLQHAYVDVAAGEQGNEVGI